MAIRSGMYTSFCATKTFVGQCLVALRGTLLRRAAHVHDSELALVRQKRSEYLVLVFVLRHIYMH